MGTRRAMEGKGPGRGWDGNRRLQEEGFFVWTLVGAGELERCGQKLIQSS